MADGMEACEKSVPVKDGLWVCLCTEQGELKSPKSNWKLIQPWLFGNVKFNYRRFIYLGINEKKGAYTCDTSLSGTLVSFMAEVFSENLLAVSRLDLLIVQILYN